MFDTSKFRNVGNIRGNDAKEPDTFGPRGRMFAKDVTKRIDMLPINKIQRDYVEEVMEKYVAPGKIRITRQEFLHALDQMRKDTGDSIKQSDIDKIIEHF